MSAVLRDDVTLTSPPYPEGCDEVARLPNGQPGGVTHEQIIGALGRVEGLLEAEIQARRDFRDVVADRFDGIDKRIGDVAVEVQRVAHRQDDRPSGAIAAIAQLFERQPLLSVVFAGLVLALGSGGIISIYEALTR